MATALVFALATALLELDLCLVEFLASTRPWPTKWGFSTKHMPSYTAENRLSTQISYGVCGQLKVSAMNGETWIDAIWWTSDDVIVQINSLGS
jgi:hypothetical protein